MVGKMIIAGREIDMRVALGNRFPHELPHLFIENGSQLPFLPHVQKTSGWICFRAAEGLVVRTSAAEHLLEDAFELALKTIDDGLSGTNAHEVFDEFEAYWAERTTVAHAASFIDAGERVRDVIVGFANRKIGYVADSFNSVRRWSDKIKRTTEYPALYVPLAQTVLSEVVVPDAFSNSDWVRAFVHRHLSSAVANQLSQRLAGTKLWPFAVLGVPRTRSSERSLVGLHFTQMRGGHPLAAGATNEPVNFISLERCDRGFLMARSGGNMKISDARVAMVGVGSLGGYVTMALAAAGVRRFTLIDPDTMSRENLYRHVLGRSGQGLHKVVAMKRELEAKYPYLEVEVSKERAEDSAVLWTDHHLAVITSGDVNSSRVLNERFEREGVATVFSWLEPLGIGGHAMLTHVSSELGCYECLFRTLDGDEVLSNAADFAAPGQTFARDLAGCTTLFTPFGALDAVRTAELCARLVVSALSDQERQHPLLSWRGDASEFRARNFKLSPRYEQSEAAMSDARHDYRSPLCPVCTTASAQ